jgi:hypothetical protein
MKPRVSSVIPKQKDNALNEVHQDLQDTKSFDKKKKKTKKVILVTLFSSQGITHKEMYHQVRQ